METAVAGFGSNAKNLNFFLLKVTQMMPKKNSTAVESQFRPGANVSWP